MDQSIQTLESERNFLATFDEDYAGLRQVGTAKGQGPETELDKVLERLEERLAQIQVAQMTQQKRQNRQMMAEDYAGGPGLEMMLRFMANQPDKVKNAVRNGQLDSAVIDVLSRQAGLITKKPRLMRPTHLWALRTHNRKLSSWPRILSFTITSNGTTTCQFLLLR